MQVPRVSWLVKGMLVFWTVAVSFAFLPSKTLAVNCSVTNPNLKYFGYMSEDGLGGVAISPTYFAEIDSLGNTNIAWSSADKLSQFQGHELKSLLADVRWIFFDGGNLRSDWQYQWDLYRTKIAGHEDAIYGFYIDEPLWNGYTKSAFQTATKTIHDMYPDKAILAVEAAPPIENNQISADYYQYVTDIGFDYYFTGVSPDNETGWNKYMNIFNKLTTTVQGKKIWLTFDGTANTLDVVNRWPDAFERYLCLANQDDNVVGMLGFLYNSGPSYTLRSILIPGQLAYDTDFRARQVDVGKAIIANNLTPPTYMSGDLNNDDKVDINDYNLVKDNFGSPYTIYDYNDLVTNYGN